jgi:hypothetical protein
MVVGKRTIEMANGYSLAERKNGEYIIMDGQLLLQSFGKSQEALNEAKRAFSLLAYEGIPIHQQRR